MTEHNVTYGSRIGSNVTLENAIYKRTEGEFPKGIGK